MPGPVKVNQSNKLKPGKTVTYKTRDYTLAWGLEGAAKVRGTADTPEETAQGDARWLTLEHTKSRVVYPDTYPDVDVEYLLTPSQGSRFTARTSTGLPFRTFTTRVNPTPGWENTAAAGG